jgi:hypothetical protein
MPCGRGSVKPRAATGLPKGRAGLERSLFARSPDEAQRNPGAESAARFPDFAIADAKHRRSKNGGLKAAYVIRATFFWFSEKTVGDRSLFVLAFRYRTIIVPAIPLR